MTEQRSEQRTPLASSLAVYDGISSRLVGRLIDLTRKGMMLVCREPVGMREEYRLRITLPVPVGGREELHIRAVCRWCREGDDAESFVAGFLFQELLPADITCLTCLLETGGSYPDL